MVNNFLGIGGKTKDNKAKGLLVDDDGRLINRNTENELLKNEPVSITRENMYTSNRLDAGRRLSATINLSFAQIPLHVKIYAVFYDNARPMERKLVFEGGSKTNNLKVDFSLLTRSFHVEIENMLAGTLYTYPHSYAIFHDNLVENVNDRYPLFEGGTNFPTGESVNTSNIHSNGYLYARLNLAMGRADEKVRVSIVNAEATSFRPPIVIFEGEVGGSHLSIDFKLMANRFRVKFDNLSIHTTQIYSESHIILHNTTPSEGLELLNQSKKTNEKLEQTNIKLDELVQKEVNGSSVESVKTKAPTDFLTFKESPIDTYVFTKGYDDLYYVIDNDWNVKVYEDLTTENEPLETGINLYEALEMPIKNQWNNLTYIFVLPQGVTYFSTYQSYSRIHFAPDIHTEPTEVYNHEGGWLRNFGVKSYYNGLDSFIVAAQYGGGGGGTEENPNQIPVILSKDGGQTFEVISRSVGTPGERSHWHDVAFDIYSGWIITTQGDDVHNQKIEISKDLGKTWITISENAHQPTAIIPFPHQIQFGRDEKRVGIDYVDKPRNDNDEIMFPQEWVVLRDHIGWNHYARAPLMNGNEVYMSFHLYDTEYATAEHPIIVATGDWGATWHGVYMGVSKVGNFVCMDEQYVYAYKENSGGLIYAKRLNWE